jgi:hypothetical protein
MQKKNTFKNSLLSSHNNFCNINHNIISTNENNSNNYNNQSKDNIYQKNNIHIESSINIGNIIPNNNEVNNIHKISNLSEDNSDDISEMSFGVGGASKNEASKKLMLIGRVIIYVVKGLLIIILCLHAVSIIKLIIQIRN